MSGDKMSFSLEEDIDRPSLRPSVYVEVTQQRLYNVKWRKRGWVDKDGNVESGSVRQLSPGDQIALWDDDRIYFLDDCKGRLRGVCHVASVVKPTNETTIVCYIVHPTWIGWVLIRDPNVDTHDEAAP
jgi:hypothetical protein